MGIMNQVRVSRREIAVVAVMLIVVLYGLHEIFVSSASKSIGAEIRRHGIQIDALIAEASKILGNRGTDPVYAAIVAGVETDWERDPFYAEETPVVSTSNLGSLAYTGYLEMGTREVAIIDGVSYEAGDELEAGGYVVKRIRPSAVVIKEKGTGKKITVPLREE